MSQYHQLLLTMKKSRKLKTFFMLRVIEVKYNIGLSGIVEIRLGISMMLLDLIILHKLSRIFILVIPINHDLEQELKSEKRIDLLERSCI